VNVPLRAGPTCSQLASGISHGLDASWGYAEGKVYGFAKDGHGCIYFRDISEDSWAQFVFLVGT
jgi:hypothetical protein